MAERLLEFITDGTPDAVIKRYRSLPEKAKTEDFGDLDCNVVVLDTETTGFSLHHDELTQIAAARMEKGEVVDWFITFVNPGKPIPEDVAHLTNIHDDDVATAPTPEEALTDLVAFVGDAKIVAHNAEFDRNFTTKHPAGYPLLENTWFDSLDMARIALPRLKSHRLIDLVKAFGAPLSTHRADDDVAATCALYRILLAAIDAMPIDLIREIVSMATPEQWSTQKVFSAIAKRHEDAPETTFSLKMLRSERLRDQGLRAKVDTVDLVNNPEKTLAFPFAEEVEEAFTAPGTVGSLYESFETRSEQLAMALAVRDAYEHGENLVVEAGTGVGKSMAYLVPTALMAQRNGITMGIATKTNALLDQLVFHELPALSQQMEKEGAQPLTYAALKGYVHYPCLRRIERILRDGVGMRTVSGGKEYPQAPAMAALLSFIEQTVYDDLDGLKIDYRVLPKRSITTTSRDCLHRKCPFFGAPCFVHGARRRAEGADIVVTNHSLLFCDMAADGGLLPPIRHWVIDEAHGTEAEARQAFSMALEAEAIKRLAQKVSASEARYNVFKRAERVVVAPSDGEGATLFYGLTNKASLAGAAFAEKALVFAASFRDLLYFDPVNRKAKGYETVDLWLNDEVRATETFSKVAAAGRDFAEAGEKLVSEMSKLVAYIDDLEGAAAVQREMASAVLELKEMLHAAEVILFAPTDAYVYSATLSRKGDKPVDRIEALLLNVGAALDDTLYARTRSVIFTSATLTVGDSFAAFENALGLNASEHSQAETLVLPSSYNFDEHMVIYVVSDMPEPNDSSYLDALERLLVATHRAQRGSMLTLFTNRREMERSFEAVQPQIKGDDLRLVCQKWGVSVKGLRDDFLADEHLSLFALKSFWEGFDAPGATLKGVIIPKLPFARPTDPLSCERAARDDGAWRHYVLPAAVMEVKQAAGRLIRKADDRGALILADKRLLTKSYGKTFLSSLPSANVRTATIDEIAAELAAAYEQGESSAAASVDGASAAANDEDLPF